jgi:hypothetical protein
MVGGLGREAVGTRKVKRRRVSPRGGAVRGRSLRLALRALLVLRRGRWTIVELADEIGVHCRTGYRLIGSLREAGITVQVSRERERGARGPGMGYYNIPAEPLRRLLRLG